MRYPHPEEALRRYFQARSWVRLRGASDLIHRVRVIWHRDWFAPDDDRKYQIRATFLDEFGWPIETDEKRSRKLMEGLCAKE